jgi:hypothetical protein
MFIEGRLITAMYLPHYFIADLPPEAVMSPGLIVEACQSLQRNRQKYLAARSTQSLVELLCGVAGDWMRPEFRLRRIALEQGPGETGFSRATIAKGLDEFFRRFTPENFHALLVQELGHVRRLDGIVSTGPEEVHCRAALALGPGLLVHVAAGNLPNPAWMSLVLGILTRSAQFMKCASGSSLLPRLFAHSIYEADPKLGACLELAEWRGGREDLETALFSGADCVTATGSDKTLASIRVQLPGHTRFLGYGHRLSFAFVARGALSRVQGPRVAAGAAADVAAWNQLGCLSPHTVYVQHGGEVTPERFAELLAQELIGLEGSEPRGVVPAETAARIAALRGIYEVRAAHRPDTRLWMSRDTTAWTVVLENEPLFQLSCLHRFIHVRAVDDITAALEGADAVRHQVSTVGVAAPEEQQRELGALLARWGAARVCPIGRMQTPPLTWRHDGRPALGDLIRWTDVEI